MSTDNSFTARRLALLIGVALLSTNLRPFAWIGEDSLADPSLAEAEHVAIALPSVSAAPEALRDLGDEMVPVSVESEMYAIVTDAMVAAQIDRRLSLRHTGLSDRERIALSHAIVREARAFDLEPELVIAVIEVESAGYPLAVSYVGALGLMQLLPSTAEELAGKIGVEWKGDDTLFDPFVNVKLGTAYLKQLADKYDGNVNVALAAYNWGPGRIDRRLRRGATVPSKYIEQVRRARDRGTELASRSS